MNDLENNKLRVKSSIREVERAMLEVSPASKYVIGELGKMRSELNRELNSIDAQLKAQNKRRTKK